MTQIYEFYHVARHAYIFILPAVKTGQPQISMNACKKFAKLKISTHLQEDYLSKSIPTISIIKA